ncbi:pyridoxamine 5'-phosphate oxidase family protein [Streptomyces sp. NPDC008122]|uniref:pyridoxamine 5'-phosphate oxidase family protein n=1 Tax=Streptomyces sp. NPDC008122 TaxID=3364810 RepID=UPI0036E46EBF
MRDPCGGLDADLRRRTVDLEPGEALRLLSGTPLGRIVFTRHALPAIRPVHHIADTGDIVIRAHEDAALTTCAQEAGARGLVLAYEADDIDLRTRLGRSVVVTGYCRLVTDPQERARCKTVLHPWTDQHMEQVSASDRISRAGCGREDDGHSDPRVDRTAQGPSVTRLPAAGRPRSGRLPRSGRCRPRRTPLRTAVHPAASRPRP